MSSDGSLRFSGSSMAVPLSTPCSRYGCCTAGFQGICIGVTLRAVGVFVVETPRNWWIFCWFPFKAHKQRGPSNKKGLVGPSLLSDLLIRIHPENYSGFAWATGDLHLRCPKEAKKTKAHPIILLVKQTAAIWVHPRFGLVHSLISGFLR